MTVSQIFLVLVTLMVSGEVLIRYFVDVPLLQFAWFLPSWSGWDYKFWEADYRGEVAVPSHRTESTRDQTLRHCWYWPWSPVAASICWVSLLWSHAMPFCLHHPLWKKLQCSLHLRVEVMVPCHVGDCLWNVFGVLLAAILLYFDTNCT